LCLARLVDNFFVDERILKEIAAHGLLTNLQQLVTERLFHRCFAVTMRHFIFFVIFNILDLHDNYTQLKEVQIERLEVCVNQNESTMMMMMITMLMMMLL